MYNVDLLTKQQQVQCGYSYSFLQPSMSFFFSLKDEEKSDSFFVP